MPALHQQAHRAEARARSAGPSPLPAVAVGAILLAESYANLAAEILALGRMVPFASSVVAVTTLLLAVYLADEADTRLYAYRLLDGARRARWRTGWGACR